jgi:hypothetical protein
MRYIRPVTVSESVLVDSTIFEDDAPAWVSGGTYAAGALVLYAHAVWECLAAVAGSVLAPSADDDHWGRVRTSRRWAMFDEAVGSSSRATGGIIVRLQPGAVTALALLDVSGVTEAVVRVHVGATLLSERALRPFGSWLTGSAISSWYAWFFARLQSRSSWIIDDLPGRSDATITVELTGPGIVSIGTLALGDIQHVGTLQTKPSLSLVDYSTTTTDAWGVMTISRRGYARKLDCRVTFEEDRTAEVFEALAGVRGTPCVWIGDADRPALIAYGLMRECSLVIEGRVMSDLALQILSLVRDVAAGAVDDGVVAGGAGGGGGGGGGSLLPPDAATLSGRTASGATAHFPGLPTGAVGLEYRLGTGAWTTVAAGAAVVLSGLTAGDTYTLQVRSVSASGNRSVPVEVQWVSSDALVAPAVYYVAAEDWPGPEAGLWLRVPPINGGVPPYRLQFRMRNGDRYGPWSDPAIPPGSEYHPGAVEFPGGYPWDGLQTFREWMWFQSYPVGWVKGPDAQLLSRMVGGAYGESDVWTLTVVDSIGQQATSVTTLTMPSEPAPVIQTVTEVLDWDAAGTPPSGGYIELTGSESWIAARGLRLSNASGGVLTALVFSENYTGLGDGGGVPGRGNYLAALDLAITPLPGVRITRIVACLDCQNGNSLQGTIVGTHGSRSLSYPASSGEMPWIIDMVLMDESLGEFVGFYIGSNAYAKLSDLTITRVVS